MNCIGTYDGTIFYNPANKFCIISVKTADQSVPAEARSNRRYKDHLIRFTAVGYEIPRTDAVELELDGEWAKGKYGVQLQVEQWREIVPRTKNGVEGYLASGLIKGIGPKTAADIVERFGVDTLDILEHQPERLLEIRGITENKLEDIKASYAENRREAFLSQWFWFAVTEQEILYSFDGLTFCSEIASQTVGVQTFHHYTAFDIAAARPALTAGKGELVFGAD